MLAALFVLVPTLGAAGSGAAEPTKASNNWAADAELEGIVDLLDPDYQKQPINVVRLPVKYAVKSVYGKGSRTIYTFEDPNCGYCRQLHRSLKEIGDLTVYTFVVTFLGEDSVDKAHAVWCAKDRAAAWDRVMGKGSIPMAPEGCAAPVAEVRKLTGLLGINLTPTVFYADGSRMNGVKPTSEVERRLAEAGKKN
jgi:thiol:disulfide interchange protein DsbC